MALTSGRQRCGRLMGQQGDDALFTSLAVRAEDGCLSLVYKAAAEIGELGDNVAALRLAMAGDPLLARALDSPDVQATVVGHTRWASVGLISQANAHPLNSDEDNRPLPAPLGRPYVMGALNGDIDNYAELIMSEAVAVPDEVTTDAKLVPTLFSRYLAGRVGGRGSFPPGRWPFRRVCRYRRQFGHLPGPALPGSSRQRPKPQYRPGRRRFRSRQRTLRPGRGDEPLFAHGRRKRRSGGDVLAERCRHPGRDFPLPLRRHPAAGRRRRSDSGGDNDARRRPPRLQAFPVERDFRVARVGAQDPAREIGTGENGPLLPAWGTTSYPPPLRQALSAGRVHSIAGDRARHGGGGRAGGSGGITEVLAEVCRSWPCRRRSCPAGARRCRASRRHVRRPWSSPSANRVRRRTRTAPLTFCGPGAPTSSPSSTGATATSYKKRTACSTPPMGATSR